MLQFTARAGKEFSWKKADTLSVKALSAFELSQNYQKPFANSTWMDMVLPAPMQVTVSVYDVLGRKVEAVMDRRQPAGGQTLEWNTAGMASGIYFCHMQAKDQSGGEQITKAVKMMLVK